MLLSKDAQQPKAKDEWQLLVRRGIVPGGGPSSNNLVGKMYRCGEAKPMLQKDSTWLMPAALTSGRPLGKALPLTGKCC